MRAEPSKPQACTQQVKPPCNPKSASLLGTEEAPLLRTAANVTSATNDVEQAGSVWLWLGVQQPGQLVAPALQPGAQKLSEVALRLILFPEEGLLAGAFSTLFVDLH